VADTLPQIDILNSIPNSSIVKEKFMSIAASVLAKTYRWLYESIMEEFPMQTGIKIQPKNTEMPIENTALLNTIEWALDCYPSNCPHPALTTISIKLCKIDIAFSKI
jgi:hypothetical protein